MQIQALRCEGTMVAKDSSLEPSMRSPRTAVSLLCSLRRMAFLRRSL